MNDAKRELLMSYIKSNVAPILVDFIDGDNIPNSVVLPESIIGKHISSISSYNTWYEFYSNHFKNVLTYEQRDAFQQAQRTRSLIKT